MEGGELGDTSKKSTDKVKPAENPAIEIEALEPSQTGPVDSDQNQQKDLLKNMLSLIKDEKDALSLLNDELNKSLEYLLQTEYESRKGLIYSKILESSLEDVNSFLKKEENINSQDSYGETLLCAAAAIGKVEIVKLLLDKGAKVDNSNEDSETPLHIAAANGHLKVVKLLLERKADVNSENNNYNTPLHIAAANGHLEIVKLLIKHDAKVSHFNNNSETSLHFAVTKGHLEIVTLLIDKGANLDIKNTFNQTPLDITNTLEANDNNKKVIEILEEAKRKQGNADNLTEVVDNIIEEMDNQYTVDSVRYDGTESGEAKEEHLKPADEILEEQLISNEEGTTTQKKVKSTENKTNDHTFSGTKNIFQIIVELISKFIEHFTSKAHKKADQPSSTLTGTQGAILHKSRQDKRKGI